MQIFKTIEAEINSYMNDEVEISEGVKFNQYQLVNRILRYANKQYPGGNKDKQGAYKYWVDITSPRIDAEVKNIDFDTKDIFIVSEGKNDVAAIILMNLALDEWLRDNNKAVELNDTLESGSAFGNVVWKKIKNGYEKCDIKNLFVLNQTAEYLTSSPVIERHILTQSDIREKSSVWDNVDEVIEYCGNKSFSSTVDGQLSNKETPYYEIFERNGEISERDLFEAQGKNGGDENRYVLAKIIVSGVKKGGKDKNSYVLFAEKLTEMPYKEYHRGRYNGRWFRVGLYETLFDIQTRANAISNQIARGLDWASKAIFRSTDRLLVNNILTQLKNGDVIKSTDLQQITVRMEGLDQLLADWNRLMQTADALCNSYEVVMGESLPSGTSFKLGNMVNQNATKLFDYIREKFALSIQEIFNDWLISDLVSEMSKKRVLSLTGDETTLDEFYKILINGWYIKNLPALPPHTKEEGDAIKEAKLSELKSNKNKLLDLEKGWLDGVKPRIHVVITGENIALQAEMETLATFITLEADPIRRTALIELAMEKKGINVSKLPKTPVPPPQPAIPTPGMVPPEEKQMGPL